MNKPVDNATRKRMSISARRAWTPARRRAATTPLPTKKVRAMYRSGLSQRKIAQALDVGEQVIRKHMRRHGIKTRKFTPPDQWGSNSHMWKGSHASYDSFHRRVERRLGKPQRCDKCGTTDPKKKYDWANLSGRYDDIGDYRRLCHLCHMRRDSIVRRLRASDKPSRPEM